MELPLGTFFGLRQIALSNPAFDFRLMAASGAEHDVTLHSHENAHFVLVLAGRYVSSARGASPDLPAPTLIFNPAGTRHRDRFRNGHGLFLTVSRPPEAHVEAVTPVRSWVDPVCLSSAPGYAAAFRIVREMHGAQDASLCESFAWELVGAAGAVEDGGERSVRCAREAYELIMDRAVETGLCVRDVAAAVALHPVHLARLFRRHWGCAPAELIRWRRLDLAAELLRSSETPVAEIAAATGFVDQSHLTRAFKAAYGSTPATFRRLHVARIQDRSPRLRLNLR
jgi:AraC family transcriptional regulator